MLSSVAHCGLYSLIPAAKAFVALRSAFAPRAAAVFHRSWHNTRSTRARLSIANGEFDDYDPRERFDPFAPPPRQGYRRYQPRQRPAEQEVKVTFQQADLSRFLLPGIGVVALATFIGPFVGALVMGSLALGAALTAGAAMFTLAWLLIPLMIGASFLMFGGLAFGVVATTAGAFLLPMLAMVGGSVALGSFLMKSFRQAPEPVPGTVDVKVEEPEETLEERIRRENVEDARRMAAELRSFDEVLSRREEKRRVDDWRN
ncbi:hypothetical protein WJX72_004924 [[Myrmecia] bisecta]|uniref:Transmembrane protein n=1 Tax=[Myrmecia] bisecta TaxID=41462 RepID=A0AAW1Q781_9CHLO